MTISSIFLKYRACAPPLPQTFIRRFTWVSSPSAVRFQSFFGFPNRSSADCIKVGRYETVTPYATARFKKNCPSLVNLLFSTHFNMVKKSITDFIKGKSSIILLSMASPFSIISVKNSLIPSVTRMGPASNPSICLVISHAGVCEFLCLLLSFFNFMMREENSFS